MFRPRGQQPPLGTLELREEDYAWVTRKLMEIADKSAEGRIVSVLEGGYDLQGLRDSVAVHVAALMNKNFRAVERMHLLMASSSLTWFG